MLSGHFGSFAEFSERVVGWDIDFRQMSSSVGGAEIFQGRVGSVFLSRARFDCQVDQHGSTPPGMRTFALLDKDSPKLKFFNYAVEQSGYLLAFPAFNEVRSFSQPGFSTCTFSLPAELIDTSLERRRERGCKARMESAEFLLPLNSLEEARLRRLLGQLESLARNSEFAGGQDAAVFLQEELLSVLIDALCGDRSQADHAVMAGSRRLARLLGVIEERASDPLHISELGDMCGISERTLRDLFRRQMDISPKVYLNATRLYAVHSELWRADPDRASVTSIANRWGYWHLSQFAADYRKMFGERPSRTLNFNA